MAYFIKNNSLTLSYLVATLATITLATQLGSRLELGILVLLGVISPMILAIIFSGYGSGWHGIKRFLGRPEGFQFNLLATSLALLLPFILMIFSIWLSTGNWVVPDWQAMLAKLPILLILMTGEEFGWRRYAFARLSANNNFMGSALLVSIVWWSWHYPGYLVGMGTPDQLPFWMFGVMLLPASILMCYLYAWTKNVYLVILVHVSSNMAFNGLPFLPEFTGDTGPFIIYSCLLWLLVLPLLLNKRHWIK